MRLAISGLQQTGHRLRLLEVVPMLISEENYLLVGRLCLLFLIIRRFLLQVRAIERHGGAHLRRHGRHSRVHRTARLALRPVFRGWCHDLRGR